MFKNTKKIKIENKKGVAVATPFKKSPRQDSDLASHL
jgi:hypothetical protein